MAPLLDAVGTIFTATGTGPVTGTRPSGMATGQLEVAFVGARENVSAITCATSGWLKRGDIGDGGNVRMSIWTHPYTAGDPVPSFSATDAGGGVAPNGVFGILGRVSGHDPTAQIDVTATTAFGDSQTMTGAGLTTVTADALVLLGFISSNDVGHTTPGNGSTLVTNQLSNVASQAALSITRKAIPTAGATGSFGLVQDTSTRYQWAVVTVAIRPASAGGGPVSLAGTSGAAAAASGSLASARPLAGTSGAAASATGTLARARPLAGTSGAAASAAGTAAVARPLVGASGAVAALAGSLSVLGGGQFQGASGAVSALAGTLVVDRGLTGAVGAVSAATAALHVDTPGDDDLAGELGGVSALAGTLVVSRALAGGVDAVSGHDAALNIVGFPPPILDPLPPRRAGWRPSPRRTIPPRPPTVVYAAAP